MADDNNPASWGAIPVDEGPAQWGAIPVTDESQSQLKSAFTDVPHEIYSAGQSALTKIGEALNPFSEAKHAAYARAAAAPSFMGTMGEVQNQAIDTGEGLGAVAGLIGSPVTGAARSLIGHPYSALTGIPYEQAKSDVDTAMMGLAPKGFRANGPVPTSPAPPIAAPSVKQLKQAAGAGYDTAKSQGLELSPQSIRNTTTGLMSKLNEDGIDEILAPKTFGVLGKLTDIPDDGVFTVNNYRTVQRKLGNVAKSPDQTERLAASRANEALGNFFENIPLGSIIRGTPEQATEISGIIKEANKNYAAAKRSEMVQGKIDLAELNASTANSGQNLDNAIRQQVKTILRNPKLQRGFSTDEIDQMNQIAKGTAPGNVLRAVGNMLGGGGGMHSFIAGGTGVIAAGPMGAVVPAAGWMVKKLGNALTARQAEALGEMVRSRAPLAKSMQAASDNLRALQANPGNPARFSVFANSVGNLSNWLNNAGINMPPGSIFRALQSPGTSQADQNQQNIPGPPAQ
jgi:hypothetical protein